MPHFPLKHHIEKAQRMASGLGLVSTTVRAIAVCDRPPGGATRESRVDAFGDSRQLDPH